MPTLEEVVTEEQTAHDADQAADAEAHENAGDPTPDETDADPTPDTPAAGEQAAAFNVDDYNDPELAIDKIDGHSVDRIVLKFSGEVHLDRSDKADVALYRDLRLGRDVTLMVEGKCLGTAGKGATSRDGDLDVIIGAKTVKVTTVYRPAAEDLAAELERTGTAAPDDEAA